MTTDNLKLVFGSLFSVFTSILAFVSAVITCGGPKSGSGTIVNSGINFLNQLGTKLNLDSENTAVKK